MKARKGIIDMPGYAWPTRFFNRELLEAFYQECVKARISYHLGAKVPFHGAKPGRDFETVDCSGFVREAAWRAAGFDMIDGSVRQHDWVKATGFKKSNPAAGLLKDGYLRIAFLPPTAKKAGHVAYILNGKTYESYGGVGVGRRTWGGSAWNWIASVYVIDIPRDSFL